MLHKSALAASAAFALAAAAPAADWGACQTVTITQYGTPVWVANPTQAVQSPPYSGAVGGSPVLGLPGWTPWTGSGGMNNPFSATWGPASWGWSAATDYDEWGNWVGGAVSGSGSFNAWEAWTATARVHINPNPTAWQPNNYNYPWPVFTVTVTNPSQATQTVYGNGPVGWEVWQTVSTGANGGVTTVTYTQTVSATLTQTVSATLTGTSTSTTTGSGIVSPTLITTSTTSSGMSTSTTGASTSTSSTSSGTSSTTTSSGIVSPTLISTTTTSSGMSTSTSVSTSTSGTSSSTSSVSTSTTGTSSSNSGTSSSTSTGSSTSSITTMSSSSTSTGSSTSTSSSSTTAFSGSIVSPGTSFTPTAGNGPVPRRFRKRSTNYIQMLSPTEFVLTSNAQLAQTFAIDSNGVLTTTIAGQTYYCGGADGSAFICSLTMPPNNSPWYNSPQFRQANEAFCYAGANNQLYLTSSSTGFSGCTPVTYNAVFPTGSTTSSSMTSTTSGSSTTSSTTGSTSTTTGSSTTSSTTGSTSTTTGSSTTSSTTGSTSTTTGSSTTSSTTGSTSTTTGSSTTSSTTGSTSTTTGSSTTSSTTGSTSTTTGSSTTSSSTSITSITSTSTSSSSTTTSSSSTTATGPCATITGSYVLQASGTGDFAVDGNFAQLQSAFGSGYRVLFSANRQNAQQFKIQPDCSLTTSDGGLLAMVGGTANLHYQYFFPSTAAASALVNVNWSADVCNMNADNTLTCTAMDQSIFQVTSGDPTLQIGDQNYGEAVTINMIPVPGTVFRS